MNIDLTKTQQYLEWLKNKLYLNSIAPSAKNRIVYRGQVYRCNLGVDIGRRSAKIDLVLFSNIIQLTEHHLTHWLHL